jgi:hypothetical protein
VSCLVINLFPLCIQLLYPRFFTYTRALTIEKPRKLEIVRSFIALFCNGADRRLAQPMSGQQRAVKPGMLEILEW